MPDITMCMTEDCPLFKECYRAQAVPNPYRQSYAKFEWVKKMDGTACQHFILLYGVDNPNLQIKENPQDT